MSQLKITAMGVLSALVVGACSDPGAVAGADASSRDVAAQSDANSASDDADPAPGEDAQPDVAEDSAAFDSGVEVDAGVSFDAGGVIDTGVVLDSGVVLDTGVLVDTGVVIDSGVCPPGTASCGGRCVDIASSLLHCGRCNNACSAPANGAAACVGGACTVGACSAGFANCDGNGANGCEVNTQSSVLNCGACGNACPARANAASTCAASACGFTCNAGFANCDGTAGNGCEANTQSDVNNCGACGVRCGAGMTCVAGSCRASCDPPLSVCGAPMSCVDTRSDLLHCGGCGNACPARANAASTCAASACGFTCNAGFANCDGTVSNGCEANTQSDVNNCGGCANVCPAVTNGTRACNAGACGVASCNAGFANCDGNGANGCEVNTQSSVLNCGACGNACPARANAASTCMASACGFTCNAGFANCDGIAGNGCEVSTQGDVNNCGGCANVCPAVTNGTRACVAGACAPACNPGYHRAGSGCFPDGLTVRLIAPLSVSTVLHRRPRLEWEVPAGADGVEIELCRDRACSTIIETISTSASSARSTVELPSGPIFWRGRARVGALVDAPSSATWVFHVRPLGVAAEVLQSIDSRIDVNADGFDDVVISDPWARSRGAITGTVAVFHGSASGAAALPSVVLVGDATNREPTNLDSFGLGSSVQSAGDVNGDGYGDLIVTGSVFDSSGVPVPMAALYLGAAMGLISTPAAQWGGTSGTPFSSISAAGDVNHDGYGDVVVGDPYATNSGRQVGAIRAYLGGRSGLDMSSPRTVFGAQIGEHFGWAVVAAGDLNFDGFADVLVGAPDYAWTPGSVLSAGRVVLVNGNASGLSSALTMLRFGTSANTRLGVGLTMAYGIDPRYIATTGNSTTMRYVGDTFSVHDNIVSLPGSFARSLDFNGDGAFELLQGTPDNFTIYFTPFTGAGASSLGASVTLRTDRPGVGFGATVAAGDFNGDGFDDALVGSWTGGSAGTGSVRVYYGRRTVPTIPSTLPVHTREWSGDSSNRAFCYLPR